MILGEVYNQDSFLIYFWTYRGDVFTLFTRHSKKKQAKGKTKS